MRLSVMAMIEPNLTFPKKKDSFDRFPFLRKNMKNSVRRFAESLGKHDKATALDLRFGSSYDKKERL